MSTITRTLGNLRKVGIKNYLVQMWYIGDTKYGQLVGTDRAGNKYFENTEELPLRTRWVEYAKHDFDAAQAEPGWHAWLAYNVDKAPTEDALLQTKRHSWERPDPIPNYTATRGAYKPYNTTTPKLKTWEPVAAARQ